MKISFLSALVPNTTEYFLGPYPNKAPLGAVWEGGNNSGGIHQGSSGGPVFNQNNKVVGILSAAMRGCPVGEIYAGRFSASWLGGNTPDTQLKYWLDPINSNATTTNHLKAYIPLPPVISGSTPICSGSQYSFSSSNWVSGAYKWAKSSNLSLGTNNDITNNPIDVKANGSNVGWVRVMFGSTIMAEYPVWVGIPDPFLYLLIEGQNGLYPPGWYITNYITACPLEFIALYPIYNEPTGVLEFQGQSSNISGIKFTSPDVITFKTTAKVGAKFSFDIRYQNTCGWSSSWATINIDNVNCSKSPVIEEYKWKVYPNPTGNILYIEQDMEAFAQSTDLKSAPTYDIRLYDGQGNLLRQSSTKGGTTQFNVSNLPDGLYYLHIYDGVNSTPEIQQIEVAH